MPMLRTVDVTRAVSTPTILISVRTLTNILVEVFIDAFLTDRVRAGNRLHLFPKFTFIFAPYRTEHRRILA